MNRKDEFFDQHGFKAAIAALTSLSKITAIQKAAQDSFNAEISVLYSKLNGLEHTIYFLVHRQDDVRLQSKTDLMAKLSGFLSYDEVIVYTENSLSKASFDTNYSASVRVSPENIEALRIFITEYTHFIDKNRSKSKSNSNSPVYDNFVELLKESDTDEQENLLRRFAQDCEDMGIEIDVQMKRQKMENK